MELKDIKLIIDLMKKNDLSVFKLEKEGFKIVLERGTGGAYTVVAPPAAALSLPAAAAPAVADAAAPAKTEVADGHEITSPMVGTFYAAPSPESPAYVKVGDTVSEDTVVCIIEAMKVMNEIKAEARGVITQVLVENAKPVEFGQPLFKIRPA